MNKQASFVLKTFVSVALICYLIYSQDFNGVKEGILAFNPIFFFIALAMALLGIYISSIRWKVILESSNVHVGVKELAYLYIKGYFYNNFLPTQMGGDVYKSISLGKKIDNQSVALFSVFMDRFGGLIVLLIMAFFGIASIYGGQGFFAALILLIVGLLVYFPVINFLGKRNKFFKNFKDANVVFLKDKKSGFLVLGLSFLVQIVSFSSTYLLFSGLNINLSLRTVFLNLPLVSLSSLIPFSFNGIGMQETVYKFLFETAGITAALAITVSIMTHVVRLILSLVGGVLILFGIEK